MATLKIKTTYSLDPETIADLERIAAHWDVSKSEALRRVIRAGATEVRPPGSDALEALDHLQASLSLDAKKAKAWSAAVRAERRASAGRREGGAR
jgi:hypothetical protein